jgi:hypothetical protein
MRVATGRARRFFGAILIALYCTPAFSADPLTLLLLRIIRDKVISAGIESAVEQASGAAPLVRAAPDSPRSLPGLPYAGFDEIQLRRLIEEGFIHLTEAQRNEVYVSVLRIVSDPKNAPEVPAIIADLAIKASAVRQAHEQISSLPSARKRQIAAEAREEYEKMPVDMREQMASVLRQRLVPLPSDLTDMILAEFDLVRARTVATQPVPTSIAPSTASNTN